MANLFQKFSTISLIIGLIGLILPFLALARVGVGVRGGNIMVEQPLKPGTSYEPPALIVVNTGDEASEYIASVQYHADQEKKADMGLAPPREWFSFVPAVFKLEPGQEQSVAITLNLPANAKPGKYFAYLEGQAARKRPAELGGTVALIGVAAAKRLWFTVVPANIWQKIYWDMRDFYALHGFWINLAAVIIAAAIAVVTLRKIFRFTIGLRR